MLYEEAIKVDHNQPDEVDQNQPDDGPVDKVLCLLPFIVCFMKNM
jgi:hypothetical protein